MNAKWFVRGDLDGFFGLFVDNLLQLMLVVTLCPAVCGMDPAFVVGKILPGAALSILVGNLFYAWQAKRLADKTGRSDITALPYGINTPSLVAYIFLIMGPVFQETKNANLAWQAGLFACFLSGVMETIGAFVAEPLRRATPRAALLSALAGIAITFIAMGFIFQIFASPLIALVPTLIILINYASRLKLPLGIPAGLVAVIVGAISAWLFRKLGWLEAAPALAALKPQFHAPTPAPADVFALLTSPTGWKYFSIILPMGLFNVIGSLQNLESAEAAGDRFDTRSSLLANGVGSLCAAFFGSAFPTTIYIGHPGWKAMGARIGYSILNGTVISLLCFFGGISLVLQIVPVEATLGILLWIAIIITAQAFQEIPKQHALAVALGLVPSLAAWALLLIETSLRVAGTSLFAAAPKFGADLYIHGIIALNQGFILSAMVLSAMLVFIIERKFLRAAGWAFAAGVLSAVGLIHAYTLTETGVANKYGYWAAGHFALAYFAGTAILVAFHFHQKANKTSAETAAETVSDAAIH
jgi:AGZA family xanthine/uracil permease-like MFS transporter